MAVSVFMLGLAGNALAEPGPEALPGKVLVEFKRSTPESAKAQAAAIGGGRIERRLARGKYAVLNAEAVPAPTLAARMRRLPEVATAAPVYRRRLASTVPNDPNFASHQWALNNTGQTVSLPEGAAAGTPDADIDAPEAWDLTTGTRSVTVAVIDTGIALSNPSLSPNLWVNAGEIPNDTLDNDGNGYIDDVNGYNFPAGTANPSDDNGHGSFCAGIIGARGNDGVGIAGINWSVSLMALKAFNSSGYATDAELVEAIEYAADNGARIINASWGDYAWSPVVESAVRSAGEKGVLLVAAAGNDGACMKELPFYPAALTLPNLLSVGSTSFTDSWSSFSNFDDTLVDLFAPGERVYSTRTASVGFGNGTSYAAPHVCGAAALLLAREPGLTPAELCSRLRTSSEVRPSLSGRASGSGRLSAFRALTLASADASAPAPVTDLAAAQAATNGLRLTFTAPGDDGAVGTAALYDIRISKAPISPAAFPSTPRVPHVPPPSPAGSAESLFVLELEPATTYHIRLLALDEAGNSSSLSNELVVTTADRTVLFLDDMENGAFQWTVSGSFALTSETAAGGSWCWTDSPGGSYAPGTSATLTSLPFSLAAAENPWLRFHHQYLFDNSTAAVADSGEVLVTTDSITFVSLARYVDFATPWRHTLLNLQEFAGEPNVRLQFRFQADALNRSDGWFLDDIEVFQPASLVPEPADLVLESRTPFELAATPAYEEGPAGGPWTDSASKAVSSFLRAGKSRYNVTDSSPLASWARFTPLFAVEGEYEVFAIWGSAANASNVRYRVSSREGVSDVYLTQNGNANSHQWISLGTYRFDRGRSAASGSVLIDESSVTGKPLPGSEGRAYSDAIRFVYRGPLASRIGDWPQYSGWGD